MADGSHKPRFSADGIAYPFHVWVQIFMQIPPHNDGVFDRPQIKAYIQNRNTVNVKSRSCIFAKLTNTPLICGCKLSWALCGPVSCPGRFTPAEISGDCWIGVLIKRSNLMQQYADIYLLQSHSTCFGRHSTHHQEY